MCVYMQGKEESRSSRIAPLALCLLLSLLIHGGAVGALPYALHLVTLQQGQRAARPKAPQRVVQISRQKPQPTQFVKTDPDVPEQLPEEADFIGKRNSSESASEYAPKRYDDAPLPTQNGAEDKQELVTFDQTQQQGDLADDGSVTAGKTASQASTSASPDPAAAPLAEQTEAAEEEPPMDGTVAAVQLPVTDDDGSILIQTTHDQQEEQSPIKIEMEVQPTPSRPSATQQDYYDPTLAEHMQQKPGFRTNERRTRSTGRFVIGRKPALNVAATPRGKYEEEIYRRIAYHWYIACDEHRGDIIPGSIVISLRINNRGQLHNMELVRRQGASMSQQSFTFGAIRRASFPPMPDHVRQEMVGDQLELIYQFNFD